MKIRFAFVFTVAFTAGFFLLRCKTTGNSTQNPKGTSAKEVETIGTVRGHPGDLLSDPDPRFDYVWNGKVYEGSEMHTSFFVYGEKYIVTIADSSKPGAGKLRFDNPVFLDTERVRQVAGMIVRSDVYGVVYEYSVNGSRYKKELFKPNVNAAATGKKLFLVLADATHPARSIIFPDEPLTRDDSTELAGHDVITTYGNWLRRGIYRSNAPIDPAYSAHGAYYCLPDAQDSALMQTHYRSPWLEMAWNERKLRFDKQVELLKKTGVAVFPVPKKSLLFNCDDGLSVFFDLHQYKNPYTIVLFNGDAYPVVRDAYIDDAPYFYKDYFGKHSN